MNNSRITCKAIKFMEIKLILSFLEYYNMHNFHKLKFCKQGKFALS